MSDTGMTRVGAEVTAFYLQIDARDRGAAARAALRALRQRALELEADRLVLEETIAKADREMRAADAIYTSQALSAAFTTRLLTVEDDLGNVAGKEQNR